MSDEGANQDDPLLSALGALARQEDEEADALWQAVIAKDDAGLPNEEPSLQVLEPLQGEERAALLDLVMDRPAEAEAPAPVIDLASRRKARLLTGGIGLAIAAALTMFVFAPAATLPAYELEMKSAEQVLRGSEVESNTYTEGSVMSAVLRPSVATDEQVHVRAVLLTSDGSAHELTLPTQETASGAFRITAVIGRDIKVGPGAHQIVFLVATQGAMPSEPSHHHTTAPPGGQRLQYNFQVSTRE